MNNPNKANTVLQGSCNGGTTLFHEKGTYGEFEMWLNRNGIDNILLITQLEKYDYHIKYNTIKDWIVHNPEVV